MSRTYVVDLDDFADVTVPKLDTLTKLKEQYPDLRVTLFSIPKRLSASSIEKARALGDWLYLAPHGWRHTRGECLSWSQYETEEKIKLAAQMGIDAPCFRAPAWLIDEPVYDACAALDYVVCDHRDYNWPGHEARVYRYNDPTMRLRKTTPVHGHLTNCMDNYIDNMLADGRLSFAAGSKFLTPWEAAR